MSLKGALLLGPIRTMWTGELWFLAALVLLMKVQVFLVLVQTTTPKALVLVHLDLVFKTN